MSENPLNVSGYRHPAQLGQKVLMQGLESRKSGPGAQVDPLLQSAVKQRAYKIEFTKQLLQTQMTKDLDSTIALEMAQNPGLRNNVYIGIITGSEFSAEVVPMEQAVNSVVDGNKAEVEQLFRDNPVGYYQPDDFTLKTPDEDAYRNLQRALNDFFKRNHDVIQYLRQNPSSEDSGSQGVLAGLN